MFTFFQGMISSALSIGSNKKQGVILFSSPDLYQKGCNRRVSMLICLRVIRVGRVSIREGVWI
ncbi:hypothetical protein CYR40_17615 [Chimaeribacter arupi]|nr:hypothetical protein CYR40_17615 [Chimaeribacter arupi]PLR43811.1 hypothetical protein CYR52_19185 [Chimaeribacter arupi]